MPDISLRQLASSAAATIAAEFVRAGLEPPAPGQEVVGHAVVEEAGLRVVVSITRYPGAIPPQSRPLLELREIERRVYDQAPATGETPVTMKKLARLSEYAYNTYFRDAVRRLIDLGLLARCTGGVRKT